MILYFNQNAARRFAMSNPLKNWWFGSGYGNGGRGRGRGYGVGGGGGGIGYNSGGGGGAINTNNNAAAETNGERLGSSLVSNFFILVPKLRLFYELKHALSNKRKRLNINRVVL
jgi:hypothetical protein